MFQCDLGLIRNQFCKHVGLGQWEFLNPGDVFDGHFRCHGTKGDNLGNFVFAVFFNHPFQYFVPSVLVKVDINIRQGHAIKAQEAFEKQVVFQRINIGDTGTIGNDRTCC